MSSTDRRVVEMVFDNQAFEKGVAKTLDTLKQLNEALNLTGVVKGFTLDPMVKSINAVAGKFSVLEVAAMRAVQRITDKVINAGERIVKSVTIEPVSSGWDKYAQKTTGVQTIIAATGKSIEDVNEQLEKLNWFTDETSYNFTDMITNIGKFTSAGVELETAVTAMEGISTWASLSGQGVNEAGRAMYNLAQAMSTGTVKLMDWRSIENANMATQEFKNTVLEAAVAEGQLKKTADGVYATMKGTEVTASKFNETLSEGWFTSKVLLDTLNQYGGAADKIAEYSDASGLTTTRLLQALTDFQNEAISTNEVLEKYGDEIEGISNDQFIEYLDELSKKEYELGIKSFKAAQEAKTFTEAIDATKDAVSTGWMTTFEHLFGNYEEAKVLWTNLANEMYDVFAESGNKRNKILKEWKTAEIGGRDDLISAISTSWSAIRLTVGEIKGAFDRIFGSITAKRLTDFVTKFKKFSESITPTKERLSKLNTAFSALFGSIKQISSSVSVVFGEFKTLFDYVNPTIDYLLDKMSQLNNVGLYKLSQTLSGFNGVASDIVETVRRLGISIKIAFDNVSGGRNMFTVLYGKLNRMLVVILELANVIGETTKDEAASFQVFLTGLFTAIGVGIDLITRAIEVFGGFAKELAGPFIKSIGSALRYIGRLMQGLDSTEVYSTWERFLNFVVGIANAVHEAFEEVFGGKIQNAISYIIEKFKEFIRSFELSEQTVPRVKNIFKGFFTVVKWGFLVFKNVIDILAPIGKLISPLIDKILDLGSAIGQALTDADGTVSAFLTDMSGTLGPAFLDFFVKLGEKITDFLPTGEEFKDWLETTATKLSDVKERVKVSMKPLTDALSDLKNKILDFFGIDVNASFGQNVLNVLDEFRNKLKKVAEDIKMTYDIITGKLDAETTELPLFVRFLLFVHYKLEQLWESIKSVGGKIKNFFTEHGEEILKGSFFTYILESLKKLTGGIQFSTKDLKESLTTFKETVGEITDVIASFGGKGKKKNKKDDPLKKMRSFAITVLLLAAAVAILGSVGPEKVGTGMMALAASLQILGKAYKQMFPDDTKKKGKKEGDDNKSGLMGLAASMILMALALKVLASLDTTKMISGILGLVGIMAAIALFLKVADKSSISVGTGIGLLGVANAILVITAAVLILTLLRPDKVQLALMAIGEIMAGFMLFAAVVDHVKPANLVAAGVAMVLVSGALMILSGVIAIFTLFKPENLIKAILGLTGVLIVISASLAFLAKQKAGGLLSAAVAINIVALALLKMTIPLSALALMKPEQFNQAVMGFIALVGSITLALVALSNMGGDDKGLDSAAALLVASIAMSVLAGALRKLSKIKIHTLLIGLVGLAVALTIMYVALKKFSPMADELRKFSVSLLIFSAALLVLGLALQIISIGLIALGPAVVILLAVLLKAIAYAIPFIIEIIVDSILWLLEEVSKHGEEFVDAFSGLLISLLYLLRDLIPPLVDIVVLAILAILAALDKLAYPVIAFLISVLAKIILGLADGMAPLVASALILIVKFINAIGVGIAQAGGPVATALENVIKGLLILVVELLGKLLDWIPGIDGKIHDFAQSMLDDMEEPDFSGLENMMKEGTSEAIMNGFAHADDGSAQKALDDMMGDIADNFELDTQAISGKNLSFLSDGGESITEASNANLDVMRDFNLDFYDAGEDNGTFAVDGLTDGLLDGLPDVTDAGLDLSSALTDSVTSSEGLDINSPSKKMRLIGQYATDGFVQGIQDGAKAVRDASNGVSDEAVAGMSNAIGDIAEVINDDPNINPVITPVVDMSEADKTLYGHFNNLNAPVNATVNGDITRQFDAYSSQAEATKTQTAAIIAELRRLRDDFGIMTDRISNIQMVLDTGALVGSMVIPMDAALGRRAQFKGRRN